VAPSLVSTIRHRAEQPPDGFPRRGLPRKHMGMMRLKGKSSPETMVFTSNIGVSYKLSHHPQELPWKLMLDVVVLLFFVMHVYHALDDLDCFNMVQRFWFFGEHVSFKTLKPGVLLGSCHPQCVLLAFTRPLDPLQPGKPGAKVLYSSRRPSLRMRTQCEAGDHLRSSDKARTVCQIHFE